MKADDPAFILQLTDWQNRLFGYLVTLLGNVHDARDVLQETNLVLCRKAEDFSEGTNFGAWARSVAHFQALAFLRDRKRESQALSREVLTRIAEQSRQTPGDDEEQRELALRACLAALSDGQRRLIRRHYEEREAICDIARSEGKPEGSMRMTLMRIRQALLRCIEIRLAEEQAHG